LCGTIEKDRWSVGDKKFEMQQIGTLVYKSSGRREKTNVMVAFKWEEREILLWIKN